MWTVSNGISPGYGIRICGRAMKLPKDQALFLQILTRFCEIGLLGKDQGAKTKAVPRYRQYFAEVSRGRLMIVRQKCGRRKVEIRNA